MMQQPTYDLTIIGAGPAGISMAAEARTAGIAADRILVIERAPEHSFTLRKYYPDGKLVTANYKGIEALCTGVMCIPDLSKQQTISYLDETIARFGLRVRYSETVHRIEKHDGAQAFTIHTDKGSATSTVVAVAIGILGKPNKPDYKIPPSLKDRILFDLTSREVRSERVLVVGGGDSASEYCQYLAQRDCAVTLSYRRKEFSRMNDINRESLLALAERGKVEILPGSTIAGVSDAGGKPLVRFSEPTPTERTFDTVVYALGGTTPSNFLRTIGIEFDGPHPRVKHGHETSVPGLFLLGDLSAGTKGGSIIWAFNASRTAMRRICSDYLGCTPAYEKQS